MSSMQRITARFAFPVCGPPIERPLLEITSGQITDLKELRGAAPEGTRDFGNAAIIPGLINAHAHLEFSDVARPFQPPVPFTHWILHLLAHRRARSTPVMDLIRDGLMESVHHGTTTVGDIVTGDWHPGGLVLPDESSQLIAFRELIGLLPEQCAGQLDIARKHLTDCRSAHHARLIPGLSPHAPYSVGRELFEKLVDLAQGECVPLAMHLAETREELELLDRGTGELMEMLQFFGIWREELIPRGSRVLEYLRSMSRLDHSLAVHGNYLDDEEIGFLAAHPQIAVVYCPRTHAFFRHEPHPWRRLMEAGATVCLGTDGRSSNPDFSVWSEVRFLDAHTNGALRPQLLALATQQGARALGLSHDAGQLVPGSRAAFTAIRLPESHDSDLWSLLFAGTPCSE